MMFQGPFNANDIHSGSPGPRSTHQYNREPYFHAYCVSDKCCVRTGSKGERVMRPRVLKVECPTMLRVNCPDCNQEMLWKKIKYAKKKILLTGI